MEHPAELSLTMWLDCNYKTLGTRKTGTTCKPKNTSMAANIKNELYRAFMSINFQSILHTINYAHSARSTNSGVI